jgi:hypothetical protein
MTVLRYAVVSQLRSLAELTAHPTTLVMNSIAAIRASLLCLLLVSVGVAQGQVVRNLPKLIDSSDVVAVARVVGIAQTASGTVDIPGGQPIPAHFRIAVLHLEDILKGESASTDINVAYTILYSPGGWSGGVPAGYSLRDTLIPNSTRLVFLRSVGDHYEFTNGSYLSIVCAPEPSNSDQSPDTLSRFVGRVKDAIFSAKVSEQDKDEAILQLSAVDSNVVIPALQDFIAADVGRQDRFLRTEAIVALLDHKAEWAVGLAESELLSEGFSYWDSNLLFALTRAIPPSRSIPIVAEAFTLSPAEMRTSAAVAIYQTDSPIGIPTLLRALDDPDPEVAFAVMQGLGNLTKDYDWRPKSRELDADWFRCLNHWRDFRQRWNGARRFSRFDRGVPNCPITGEEKR